MSGLNWEKARRADLARSSDTEANAQRPAATGRRTNTSHTSKKVREG